MHNYILPTVQGLNMILDNMNQPDSKILDMCVCMYMCVLIQMDISLESRCTLGSLHYAF